MICAQVAPLNAIKNQGKEEGTVDRPFDPEELPEVAAADKACRTAMRFMRKLDRLRGNFDPRDSEADATAASTKLAATAALEACAAGAPLDAARAAVDAARSAYGLAAQAATANSVARKSAERDACDGLREAIEAAVTAVQAALAAHKNTSSAPPPVPVPAAAPVPPPAAAPVPPPAAAKPPARKLDVQLSQRSTALANALEDDKSTGSGMSAVQRRIKAIEDKMKGKKT